MNKSTLLRIEADRTLIAACNERGNQAPKPFDFAADELFLVRSNRDDKKAIELFLAAVRVWEAELSRRFSGKRLGNRLSCRDHRTVV